MTDQFGLFSDKTSTRRACTSPVSAPTVENIPVSMNLSDPIFVDLLELSVCESEIVREEKAKFADRRKQLSSELSKKSSKQVG